MNLFVKDIFEETMRPRDGRAPLSRAVAESVLGESLDNVVIYDLINNRANRQTYNSHRVVGHSAMATNAERFKKLCAKSPVIAGRVPVAVVAKTCSETSYMAYKKCGHHVVGNVVFYDPDTKEYSAFAQGWPWTYCRCHPCSVAASEQALYDAMDNVVCVFDDIEFRIGPKVVVAQDTTKKTFWNTVVDFVSKGLAR